PVITMDGGRRLEFLRAFSSEKELNPNPSFWKRALDFVAGPPDYRQLIRPYGITTDSRGRIIVADPGSMAVHIFDFDKKKYHRLEGGKGEDLLSPIGVAVDAQDNIYVTDSLSGKVFVFDADGKFRRFVGSVAKNEGFFKRATGIAIDQQQGELFVTDTLRDKIFVMDLEGHMLREFGGRGSGPGQFNFPTELVLRGNDLLVVDAMNFRVQILDRQGHFLDQFGERGESIGRLFAPRGCRWTAKETSTWWTLCSKPYRCLGATEPCYTRSAEPAAARANCSFPPDCGLTRAIASTSPIPTTSVYKCSSL